MTAADPAPLLIGSTGDSLREAFGRALLELADEYPNLIVLDADIAGGTGTHHVRTHRPQQFLQFGIAEQNMMAAAAGLEAVGFLPVVATFAVFCLRAFEQARLSIAYARRNVKIVASHPGLDVGPDGGSAQALEDLAAYRAIPGMTVISPADPVEVALATRAILDHDGPVYMRTGRSPARRVFDPGHRFQIGRGHVLRHGDDVTVVAIGVQVARALEAAEQLAGDGISARVVNMATLKPIDTELLEHCAEETRGFVTAEDHNVFGGLGGAVAEALARTTPRPIEYVGVADRFGESGDPEQLAERYGLGPSSIADAVRRVLGRAERSR
jgi:transketolase